MGPLTIIITSYQWIAAVFNTTFNYKLNPEDVVAKMTKYDK
jgi:hypothetical protein